MIDLILYCFTVANIQFVFNLTVYQYLPEIANLLVFIKKLNN